MSDLPFGQENTPKSIAGLSIRVSIADINDMQLARRHELADILARRRKLPFHIKGGTRDSQLVRELRDTSLLLDQRGFVVDAQLSTTSRLVSCVCQQFLLVARFVQQLRVLAGGPFGLALPAALVRARGFAVPS